MPQSIAVMLEAGTKKTFAAARDWPGWARSGRDESSALEALFTYAPRYAAAIQPASLPFHAPEALDSLQVAQRLPGNATTDFGALSLDWPGDAEPVQAGELERWQAILTACWDAFDRATQAAVGMSLKTGPRGGGRDLAQIVAHVRDVDAAYLGSLGGRWKPDPAADPEGSLSLLRQTILDTLASSARGEIPAQGPRGGTRWTPRYFVRRMAWHELDHTWEIEDRATSS